MDIMLAVGLGVVTAAMGYLAVHVTLHPAGSKGQKFAYKAGFAVLSTTALLLITLQAWRNSEAQRKVEGSLADLKAMGRRTESSLSVFDKGPLKVEVVAPPEKSKPSKAQPSMPPKAKAADTGKQAEKPDEKPPVQVNAPSGIAIGGGNVTNPTVNNFVPPSRTLSEEALRSFAANLAKAKSGMLRVVLASSADDVFQLSQQLCAAARYAHWGSACPQARNSLMGREAIAEGLECYSENWEADDAVAFKEAMRSVQLPCRYLRKAYDFGQIRIGGTGGVTILIGSPGRQ